MTVVRFDDSDLYQFVKSACAHLPVPHTWQDPEQALQIDHTDLAALIDLAAVRGIVMLPYSRMAGRGSTWLIAARDANALETTRRNVQRFITPTLGAFDPPGHAPHRGVFNPGNSTHPLHIAGARCFPDGYYRLSTSSQSYNEVLTRLAQYARLLEEMPIVRHENTLTYARISRDFQEALALNDGARADLLLGELRRHRLTTADNLAFLQVQRWENQLQWRKIWKHPDFADWAVQRLPRLVRRALLTAFYHEEILALEANGQWQAALDMVRRHLPKLGTLLTTRQGLTEQPVAHLFAYQASLSDDIAALDSLAESAPIAGGLLANLRARLSPAPPTASPLELVQRYFTLRDFDQAYEAATQIHDPVAKAIHFLTIAHQTEDEVQTTDALATFDNLSPRQQATILGDATLVRYLKGARKRAAGPTGVLTTWPVWFQAVRDGISPDVARPALQVLVMRDERSFEANVAAELTEVLLDIVTSDEWLWLPLIQEGLAELITVLLRMPSFPVDQTDFLQLYEYLIDAQCNGTFNEQRGQRFLRLAEGALALRPDYIQTFAAFVTKWVQPPRPVLSEIALSACAILVDYGADPGAILVWMRTWVESALSVPVIQRDTTALAVWRGFAVWAQVGDDLLRQLDEYLTEPSTEADSLESRLAALSKHYHIVIFTLREANAKIAADILRGYNPEVRVTVSAELDLSDRVIALARHADLPVVVWQAVKHATTLGIKPHLQRDPVYAESSSAHGILKAIRQALRTEPSQ